jgi:hypothetical protein
MLQRRGLEALIEREDDEHAREDRRGDSEARPDAASRGHDSLHCQPHMSAPIDWTAENPLRLVLAIAFTNVCVISSARSP